MQLIFIIMHFLADVSFVFVYSVQTPVPAPLVQFAAMCPGFPQLQQTLVSPLPPFSCPFPPFLPPVLDHFPFPARETERETVELRATKMDGNACSETRCVNVCWAWSGHWTVRCAFGISDKLGNSWRVWHPHAIRPPTTLPLAVT